MSNGVSGKATPGIQPVTRGSSGQSSTSPASSVRSSASFAASPASAAPSHTSTYTVSNNSADIALHGFKVTTNTLIIAALLLLAVAAAATAAVFLHRKGKKSDSPTTLKIETTGEKMAKIRIGNAQNIGSRREQQDSFALSHPGDEALYRSKGFFAVVADGMGGLQDGGCVSRLIVETMLQWFENTPDSSPQNLLFGGLTAANNSVNRMLEQSGASSGSTVVAILIKDGALYWDSVGDSKIMLQRGRRIFTINALHNLGEEQDADIVRGSIGGQDILPEQERAGLTSYIGMGKLSRIDRNIKPFFLQKGDRILLCSDGVYNTISDEEIVCTLKNSAQQAALELERMVLQKNKPHQDNFTAVVVQYG